MVVLRVVLGLLGLGAALLTVASAVRTTVLPRAVPSRLTRVVFIALRRVFDLRLARVKSYEDRDSALANYGPFALLALLVAWLVLIYVGFALAEGATEDSSVREALRLSGSSLFTLGFDAPHSLPVTALTFIEAGIGLLLVALLISYLPTIYSAFSRREQQVNKLEVRAAPGGGVRAPDGTTMLIRAHRIGRFDQLGPQWAEMETWFVDIEETHTTFPALVFFRSPRPDQSWVTAAGAVLDAAALLDSTVDVPRSVEGNPCLRAGYIALREIAGFFRISFDADPSPGDPVSVHRAEYDEAVARLIEAGLPVVADREQAWRDFAGWRVNYDVVLVALAGLVQAPYAPWSSDRSLARRPTLRMALRRNG